MANWWMPVAQLKIMRRLAAGETLLRSLDDAYRWEGSKEKCTASARALMAKGLIFDHGNRGPKWEAKMLLTPTGKNELGYNRNREIED